MIELYGERLKRYELNRTVTIEPRHGNRLYKVRVQQSEATEPITVPHREENGAIVADIPNILMERHGTITVEVISIDKHGSMDHEKRTFAVRDNKKPDGYEYEENMKPSSGSGGGSSGSGSGGGVTSWNDLEDKPFYTERQSVAFNFDPDNPNNIVLESGDIIYYVGENTVYRDESLRVVIPELGQKKLLDSVEKTDYTAHDDEIGDIGYVEAYTVHEENPWQYFHGVLFFNEWDEMSGGVNVVDYEGERITFNVDGWYVLGSPNCFTEVYRELHHTIPEEYIPDHFLHAGDMPRVYITYANGEPNYYEEAYELRETLLKMRDSVARFDMRFTGWMEIDGIMTAIQQITYIDDEDIIKVAPYGYSFDTKYFVINCEYNDGYEVTLVTASE